MTTTNRNIRRGDRVRVVGGGTCDPEFVGMEGVVVRTGRNTKDMFGRREKGRDVTVDLGVLHPYVIFGVQSVEKVSQHG